MRTLVKVTANKKSCANCYWFRFENSPMRLCTYPDKLSISFEETEVPGDSPVRTLICGGWLDCGLLEKGLLKSTV